MIKKAFIVFAIMFLFISISPSCVIASDMQVQPQITAVMEVTDLTVEGIIYGHPADQNQELQLSLKITNVGAENISNIQIIIVAVLLDYIDLEYGKEIATPVDDIPYIPNIPYILNASRLMGDAYEIKPSKTIKLTELPQGGFTQKNFTLVFKTAGHWKIYIIRIHENGTKYILSGGEVVVSINLPKYMDGINFGLPFAFVAMLTIPAHFIHKKRKLKTIS
ncbi:MAG: hypothetical protein KJ655_01210 [Candidatus Thermoplasmatota archaeon]|nr:hypothetical protein [Candidatus Thermoplasmatota archaeon]